MLYRIVAKEDVARGLFSKGPIVEAATEEEAFERYAVDGAVLVRQIPERDARMMRIDHKMRERVMKDEAERRRRAEDNFHKFVVALTGEDN